MRGLASRPRQTDYTQLGEGGREGRISLASSSVQAKGFLD